MLYPIAAFAVLVIVAFSNPLRAETNPPVPELQPLVPQFQPPGEQIQPINVRATRSSLDDLAKWLSNGDLPYSAEPPRLERATPLRLYQMRHKAFLSSQTVAGSAAPLPGYQREVVAVYDDQTRTIFLPENWSGDTVAEQSVLVHEMVHHLQNLAGQKFSCAGEREKPAYLAQDKFLQQHGLDLEKEFDVDMFTVVAISACMN